jgi:hypothetical protein
MSISIADACDGAESALNFDRLAGDCWKIGIASDRASGPAGLDAVDEEPPALSEDVSIGVEEEAGGGEGEGDGSDVSRLEGWPASCCCVIICMDVMAR